MSEAQVAGIFEEFTQAESSTAAKFGGTGLVYQLPKADRDDGRFDPSEQRTGRRFDIRNAPSPKT